MKKVTLMMEEYNVEYMLDIVVKYRLELMEDESEFSERYRDSLSNTGYLLELIKAEYKGLGANEEIAVTFDIESYLNLFDILAHRIDALNQSIIKAIRLSDEETVANYEREMSICKKLYNQVNEIRFKVLHL